MLKAPLDIQIPKVAIVNVHLCKANNTYMFLVFSTKSNSKSYVNSLFWKTKQYEDTTTTLCIATTCFELYALINNF